MSGSAGPRRTNSRSVSRSCTGLVTERKKLVADILALYEACLIDIGRAWPQVERVRDCLGKGAAEKFPSPLEDRLRISNSLMLMSPGTAKTISAPPCEISAAWPNCLVRAAWIMESSRR